MRTIPTGDLRNAERALDRPVPAARATALAIGEEVGEGEGVVVAVGLGAGSCTENWAHRGCGCWGTQMMCEPTAVFGGIVISCLKEPEPSATTPPNG